MASTTVPSRPPQADPRRPAPALVPGGGRQRRWSLALLAVLVTVASALGFVVLWMNAGGREPVLALRNDVAAGQTIEDDDLQVVRVAADPGIDPIASSARDEVVGRPAAADLLAGTLLVPGAVGNASGLEAGQAVIAVPVSPEELPADLEGGDRVVLLRSGANGSTVEESTAETIGDGTVIAIQRDEDSGSTVPVSVRVAEGLLPEIAAAIQSDSITVAQAASS
ncbi:MAG TPA: SAF domain-containing protein [Acidimicrobiales bacterium]|nr:SAF domain-containing protein [Acidimicrobiales bacterium]